MYVCMYVSTPSVVMNAGHALSTVAFLCVYVCMYVCMYVGLHTDACIHQKQCRHVHSYSDIALHMHSSESTFAYVFARLYAHIWDAQSSDKLHPDGIM